MDYIDPPSTRPVQRPSLLGLGSVFSKTLSNALLELEKKREKEKQDEENRKKYQVRDEFNRGVAAGSSNQGYQGWQDVMNYLLSNEGK